MSFHEARIMSTLLRRYASNHDGRTFPEARQFHQPVVVCVPYASRRRAGFYSPSLPTTHFSNTLPTGGINHERTFPFWHDSHSRQDTHDGRHLARCLSAAAFAPQPSAAGDSRNLHGSCVESPCGLGGADAETRCAGVCQGLPDAETARRRCYDRGHRRAVLCPVSCRGGCGESAGKLMEAIRALW